MCAARHLLHEALQQRQVGTVGLQLETVAAQPAQRHQRDVVALLDAGGMVVGRCLHQLDEVARRLVAMLVGQRQHTVTRERSIMCVAGLVQSVGIEKQHLASRQLHLLPLELPAGQCPHRQIAL